MTLPSSGRAMRVIFVVCEGQTEETFISRVVAPEFYPIGISLVAQLIETSSGHKGGALSYDRVKIHLRNTLRMKSQPTVTTMIDLYKLDKNFPSFTTAENKPLEQRLAILNSAFHQDIVDTAGCRSDQFVPYIQPYEFEALLFSDVTVLTDQNPTWQASRSILQGVRDAVDSPEHINEGPSTKPAARLEQHLHSPRYRKALHGPSIAEATGLSRIQAECRYFAAWLERLRNI